MRRAVRALIFHARHDAFQRLFLERVAGAVAASPAGAGLFLERLADAASPTLVPTAELVEAVAAAAHGLPGALERVVRGRPREAAPRAVAALVARAPGPEGPGVEATRRERRGPAEARGGDAGESVARAFPSFPHRLSLQGHWFPDGRGRLRAWTRVALDRERGPGLAAAISLARALGPVADGGAGVVVRRAGPVARLEWGSGALRRLGAGPPLRIAPAEAAALFATSSTEAGVRASTAVSEATIVLGASGSGKTAFLAELARTRLEAGDRVVVLDVHGDLAPAIVEGLDNERRARLAALDAGAAPEGSAGIDVLAPADPERLGEDGDLVAALRRLSADGSERYWGFRLERVLEAFVRLAREQRGTLVDLARLLTDERSREAARRSTRAPDLARFLDELAGLLRRNPEYLQGAAARVVRVLGDPRLAALLAPTDGGVPLSEHLREGGSILVRLPFAELGPEATEYAASLLATRLYLALARTRTRAAPSARTWFLADEAHLLAPRLLAEAIADGRKFGVIAVAASQYPDRFAEEVRSAAAGAAGCHLVFRVPLAAARSAGSWVGLGPTESEALLPALPPGVGVLVRPGRPRALVEGAPLAAEGDAWRACVAETARRFGAGGASPVAEPALDAALWSLYEASHGGDRATPGVEAGIAQELLRRRLAVVEAGTPRITRAGIAYLGLGRETGAVTESAEHRRLLYAAQRTFARHGERLEIVRQGRFDTTLPDGLLTLRSGEARPGSPRALLEELEARRSSWAWRCFGGRDVHVEAEVSGAERPQRIRRGLAKARAASAAVVFVVGDARRARRVRSVVRAAGARVDEAQVWTIPAAPPSDEVGEAAARS